MWKHWQYFKYVARHKWYVFQAGIKIGVPHWYQYPLWIIRLLIHDWTKFLPVEWNPYVDYFYGDKKPKLGNTGYSHKVQAEDIEFNQAWNHHQKANSHHWQYYILNMDNGSVLTLPMSEFDKREMLADWRGAGLAQGKPDTSYWYFVNYNTIQLHSDTRKWIDEKLGITEQSLIERVP